MTRAFYQPKNAWVGDFIPYYENGTYYAFYLHDPRCVAQRYAEETTWYLVSTKDFVTYTEHGEAIARGDKDSPNLNAYTGSVIRGKDGKVYAFYTAFNEDYKQDGKSVQSVMVAKGDCPEKLETDPSFRMVADPARYEAFDWRDPYVFWNEEDQCYWMLLAARLLNSGERRGGCIALCKSTDLKNWKICDPFYAPGMYITMECPEVFKMGDWWYLVFSTFSDRFMTHYRRAKSPSGPWEIPQDDTFDTRANYAIKTAGTEDKRYAFGWISSKRGGCDAGPWEWGGTAHFHEVVQNPQTGDLYVKPTEGIRSLFTRELPVQTAVTYGCEELTAELPCCLSTYTMAAAQVSLPQEPFCLKMQVKDVQATEIGVSLHTDAGLETGYFLRIKDGMLAMDRWPRAQKGFYQWQIDGDRAWEVETVRRLDPSDSYNIEIYREDSILCVYVNDKIALSTRAYDHTGKMAGLYVVGGSAVLESIRLYGMI